MQRSICRIGHARVSAGCSLVGDAHSYGMEGVRFYTLYKRVMQCWPDPGAGKGPEFPMPVNR